MLSGGRRLVSPFGTFAVPNISTDPDHGIGGWTLAELASALKRGVSPEGANYYPAFPYTTYTRMELRDIADLKAFLDTLPAHQAARTTRTSCPSPSNSGGWRAGPWKALNLTDAWVYARFRQAPAALNGRYLVEGLGHCGECHTPRDAMGGREMSRWLAGGPNPDGKGKIPNITPSALKWSEADIAEYLKSGFTPDYDLAGGAMADVVHESRAPARQ